MVAFCITIALKAAGTSQYSADKSSTTIIIHIESRWNTSISDDNPQLHPNEHRSGLSLFQGNRWNSSSLWYVSRFCSKLDFVCFIAKMRRGGKTSPALFTKSAFPL